MRPSIQDRPCYYTRFLRTQRGFGYRHGPSLPIPTTAETGEILGFGLYPMTRNRHCDLSSVNINSSPIV
ncbi:Poly [ADP-ribose] polymerase 2 [Fusarium oxysporum f. sp. albedinis]|nr:Poly [ADP-ribose] polymerase 2 [Fusarium oxysporum f. sp. albedinis]